MTRDSTIWTKTAHVFEHEITVQELVKIVNALPGNTQVELVKEIMSGWGTEDQYQEIKEWLEV